MLRTIATNGQGIAELAEAIRQHQVYLKTSGDWQRRDQLRIYNELENLLRSTLYNRWRETVLPEYYQKTLELLANRSISPLQAVERLLNDKQL